MLWPVLLGQRLCAHAGTAIGRANARAHASNVGRAILGERVFIGGGLFELGGGGRTAAQPDRAGHASRKYRRRAPAGIVTLSAVWAAAGRTGAFIRWQQ